MSLGVEWGCKYVLEGPDGTRAVFNDDTDEDFVGTLSPESSGLDSADVREDAQDATEADGGVHGDFYYGRRPVILQGTVIASGAEDRNAKVAKIKAASNALRADATLTWEPIGGPEGGVELKLRRQQPLRISKGWVKDFQIPMVSAKAVVEGATIKTGSAVGSVSGPSALKAPSTAAETGAGNEWEFKTNVLTSNNSYAQSGGNSNFTAILIGRNFAFGIPAVATITGVEGTVERKSTLGTCKDRTITLIKENTVSFGSNLKAAENWPGSDAIKTYGGAGNMWGLNAATLTPAIVNSTGFGIGVAVEGTGEYECSVDAVALKIYYKNPPIKVTVNNEGDAAASPLIEIDGPATNIVLENVTTGKSIKIDYAIAEGASLNINFANRTIIASIGDNLYDKLDFANSEWWDLAPGSNVIEATVEATETAATKLEVQFRDAYL